MTLTKHRSVLVGEVVRCLAPKDKGVYLDATFGGGGHSRAILAASKAKVVAIDRDPMVAEIAREFSREFPDRFRFVTLSYSEVETLGYRFDGAVFDLGVSTDQLENYGGGIGRGFSFARDEPLDMRFDPSRGKTAAELLRLSGPKDLVRIFQDYAQDRHAKGLAARIVRRRKATPIRTTGDFIKIVGTADPKVLAPLFQALRIAVNDELGTLSAGLSKVTRCLRSGARLAVITFHSLEDRLVKNFFRQNADRFRPLTKKPITPSPEELSRNPRARSAKLRVVVKLVNKF